MTNEGNTFFKKLNEAEKKSLLARLSASNNPLVTIWKKGKGSKLDYSVVGYDAESYSFSFSSLISLDVGEVLYTFDINGVHYFGKGFLAQSDNEKILQCSGEFYKSERRASYRLLTYPHHKIYVQIHLPHKALEDGNVVSMSTGSSETGLFKNFLNLVDKAESTKLVRDEYIRFRVLDISVTGMAIQFGEIEEKLIEETKDSLGQMFLDFNGDEILILGGELLYKVPFLAQDKKTRLFKGGIQFKNIDTNLDEVLGKKINEVLRSRESEFEDFV